MPRQGTGIPTPEAFARALQGTPMYSEASAIYNTALRNGVNPAFVSGLAGAESNYGQAGFARGKKNPYGYGVFSGGPNSGYSSYAEATDAMTKGLRGNLYYGAGKRSIKDVMGTYTPATRNPGNQHISNITSLGAKTGGDASQVFVDTDGSVVDSQTGQTVTTETPAGADVASVMNQPDMGVTVAQALSSHDETGAREEGALFKGVMQGAMAAQMAVKNFTGLEADPAEGQGFTAGLADALSGNEGTVVEAAHRQLGTPYSWGGGTPSGPSGGFGRGAGTVGFDCSSLVQYAWAKAGVKLPRTTWEQIKVGQAIPNIQHAKPGDLLFPNSGHVQMYIGNGKVIEAPQTGGYVQIVGLRDNYIAIRRPGG